MPGRAARGRRAREDRAVLCCVSGSFESPFLVAYDKEEALWAIAESEKGGQQEIAQDSETRNRAFEATLEGNWQRGVHCRKMCNGQI